MAEPFVALVTGASSGIGEATARRVAREPDARIVLVARREDRLRQLADELGGASAIAVDLTDENAPGQIRQAIESEHERLDLLVNNAGNSWHGSFGEAGWANMDLHMKLNFEAQLRLTEAMLPLLRETAQASNRRVSIVNVASTAARVSRPNLLTRASIVVVSMSWFDACA